VQVLPASRGAAASRVCEGHRSAGCCQGESSAGMMTPLTTRVSLQFAEKYTRTQRDSPGIPYLQPLMLTAFVQLCILDTPRGGAPTSSLSSFLLSNRKCNWSCTCACNVMQVEATNELGDVHAHFGSWAEAVQAWHDALDCIMGPYQVNLLKSHSLAACPRCCSHP